MPRIRTFKPEFFRSPDTARASHAARILYMALWSWANDEGIGETNLNGLLGFAFPDEDLIERAELQRLLKEIRRVYGVVFYGNRGRFYYAIPSWDHHQKTERRAAGRFPGPDDDDSYPDQRFGDSEEEQGNSSAEDGESSSGTGEQGNRGTGESSSLTLVEGGVGGDPQNLPVVAKATPADARGKKLPKDWRPTDETIALMRAQFPHLDLKAIHEEFTDYWCAVPGVKGRKTDWDATWRNRVREIATRQKPNGHARSGVGKPTQKAMGWEAAGNELLAEMENLR
jgi:hypothetical protein